MTMAPKTALSISCGCGTDYSCRMNECPGESCDYFKPGRQCVAMHFETVSFLCPSCETDNSRAWFDKINARRWEGLRDV